MEKENLEQLASRYERELRGNCLPFWLERSQDREFGGYFSCLDRQGNVYDTDKFIWLQGREVWMFAMLYNQFEKRPEWLECALRGGEFLKKYGHDGECNFYFSVTREGRPLVQPYNIFSNTFACMAFAQLAKATGNDEYAAIAKRTFDRILARYDNPKGVWEKGYPGTRPLKGFALPMIICNMALEIEDIMDDRGLLDRTIETCLHEVLDVFYKKELGVMVENVSAETGELVDCFEGRVVNPGHNLEA
ncbi:MAG: AGE family epimerase/isomerase, partial [Bacteroidales bacterium]|nr:AGE family epimerase/isomerase [Bacteroidales bacterium]